MQSQRLVWLDLEMTGLDPKTDRIIEIATVVTDLELNVVAEGPVLAVHQSDEQLGQMDAWNQKHHSKSGLIQKVKESQHSEFDAEAKTLAFLHQHLKPNQSPMCGNSICQDRRFLYEYMPKLEAFFHYRNLDVSSVKELAQYWHPEVLTHVKKQTSHQALQDVIDSIEELKVYREHFFRIP